MLSARYHHIHYGSNTGAVTVNCEIDGPMSDGRTKLGGENDGDCGANNVNAA